MLKVNAYLWGMSRDSSSASFSLCGIFGCRVFLIHLLPNLRVSFVAQLKCLCPLNFGWALYIFVVHHNQFKCFCPLILDELSTFLLIGYETKISFSENHLFHHALKQIISSKLIGFWFNFNSPDLILLQVSI